MRTNEVTERHSALVLVPLGVRHDPLLNGIRHAAVKEDGRNGLDDSSRDGGRHADDRLLDRLVLDAGEGARLEVGGELGDC